jgi:hypothetical protein
MYNTEDMNHCMQISLMKGVDMIHYIIITAVPPQTRLRGYENEE